LRTNKKFIFILLKTTRTRKTDLKEDYESPVMPTYKRQCGINGKIIKFKPKNVGNQKRQTPLKSKNFLIAFLSPTTPL
jgi:hypothetical protein